MYTDDDEKPTALQVYWRGFKKFCGIVLVLAISAGVLYALWMGASDSKVGVGAVYGIAEGVIFVICIWLGFLIGYFAGKPRSRD